MIIGTAGHIDHGKSTLVKALTDVDPDRLVEAQARGISIELGYAYTELEGTRVGFVDVPGHERLVRTMLAGATGIDYVLLLIPLTMASCRRRASTLPFSIYLGSTVARW